MSDTRDDGFVEPMPVPGMQEADEQHHRSEEPAEGADEEQE